MWEIGINNQATTFLLSVALGIGFSFLYYIFKIIRSVKKQKFITVFILDIIYFIILTVIFFCFFILRTNGEIRLFCFVGAGIGFLFFNLTLSRVLMLTVKPIRKICNFFKNILILMSKPLAKLRKIVYNRNIKIKRKLKNC